MVSEDNYSISGKATFNTKGIEMGTNILSHPVG